MRSETPTGPNFNPSYSTFLHMMAGSSQPLFFPFKLGRTKTKKKERENEEHEARAAQQACVNVRLYERVIIKVQDDRYV